MRAILFFGGAVSAALLSACLLSPSDCAADATCAGPLADGGLTEASTPLDGAGVDGGDVMVPPPPGCDPAAEPKDAPKCVVTEYGVFVDATSGSNTNSGSSVSPVKTIGHALTVLNGKARIYICAGTYAEPVKLTASVSLYGGFACGSWAYDGTKPVVQPPAGTDYALDLQASNVTIADLELDGPEIGAPNSIAVRTVNANGIVFVRSKLVGKKGANGSNGVQAMFPFPSKADLDGKGATSDTKGGLENLITCPMSGLQTKGGKGGNLGTKGDDGLPARGGGAGGGLSQCGDSVIGGANGNAGDSPTRAPGAATLGALIDDAWVPALGGTGANGGPGQGGGGGAGVNDGADKGAGGGGGAGGCGGAGGTAGGGGGASAGLLSVGSSVIIKDSTVMAGTAGDGGSGTAGQPGQIDVGSAGLPIPDGCLGGKGGPGGKGAPGGGGAGGVSAGVLYKGAKPSFEPEQITAGTAGKQGVGGATPQNDGVAIAAQTTFEVQ